MKVVLGVTAAAGILSLLIGFGPLETVIVMALIGAIGTWIALGNGEVRRFETSAQPQEVVNAAVTIFGTNKRWAVTMAGERNASFVYHRPPSKFIAFVLLLMFIVPGIVYLVLAGKRESLAISASPNGSSRTMVQATSNGWRGKQGSAQLENQVGVVAPAFAAETVSVFQATR